MSETLSASRSRAMLRTAMGPTIVAALADAEVIEIMINPYGRLWLDRLGRGRWDTGYRFEPEQVEQILRLVASHARTEAHRPDERRVGNGCVRPCRSRWSPYH